MQLDLCLRSRTVRATNAARTHLEPALACGSTDAFGSRLGVRSPFWRVVFDVVRNRSATPLSSGHTAVLYSTGPAVLREALRRLLRLPAQATMSAGMLEVLDELLHVRVLDAKYLHPVTAERRSEDSAADRPADSVCSHHFVSSWVDHSKAVHEDTEARRRAGDATAAMHGQAQAVARVNAWDAGDGHAAHDHGHAHTASSSKGGRKASVGRKRTRGG